jgi:hypothetical protein
MVRVPHTIHRGDYALCLWFSRIEPEFNPRCGLVHRKIRSTHVLPGCRLKQSQSLADEFGCILTKGVDPGLAEFRDLRLVRDEDAEKGDDDRDCCGFLGGGDRGYANNGTP